MSSIRFLVCVAALSPLAWGISGGDPGQGDASPELSTILQAYRGNLDHYWKSVSFDAQTSLDRTGDFNWQHIPQKQQSTIRVLRHEGKLDLEARTTRIGNSGQELPVQLSEAVIDGEARFFVTNEGKPPSNVGVHRDAAMYGMKLAGTLGEGVVLDGWIPGDAGQRLDQVLSGASKVTSRREPDGTVVVEAQTRYGKHTVWFDPSAAYSPKRIVVEKTQDDWLDDEQIRDVGSKPIPKFTSAEPSAPLKRVTIEVDGIQAQSAGGTVLPTSAQITTSREYADGSKTVTKTSHNRKNVVLNPSTDGAFVLHHVPDGTPVTYQDERGRMGVAFEWRSGKPQASLDEKALAVIREAVPLRTSPADPKAASVATQPVLPTHATPGSPAAAVQVVDVPRALPRLAWAALLAVVLGGACLLGMKRRRRLDTHSLRTN